MEETLQHSLPKYLINMSLSFSKVYPRHITFAACLDLKCRFLVSNHINIERSFEILKTPFQPCSCHLLTLPRTGIYYLSHILSFQSNQSPDKCTNLIRSKYHPIPKTLHQNQVITNTRDRNTLNLRVLHYRHNRIPCKSLL